MAKYECSECKKPYGIEQNCETHINKVHNGDGFVKRIEQK